MDKNKTCIFDWRVRNRLNDLAQDVRNTQREIEQINAMSEEDLQECAKRDYQIQKSELVTELHAIKVGVPSPIGLDRTLLDNENDCKTLRIKAPFEWKEDTINLLQADIDYNKSHMVQGNVVPLKIHPHYVEKNTILVQP
jgi:hypothetical protein